MIPLLQTTVEREITVWGVVIPAAILCVALLAAILLYRYFSTHAD